MEKHNGQGLAANSNTVGHAPRKGLQLLTSGEKSGLAAFSLRVALVLVGLIFVFGVNPLMMAWWPSKYQRGFRVCQDCAITSGLSTIRSEPCPRRDSMAAKLASQPVPSILSFLFAHHA